MRRKIIANMIGRNESDKYLHRVLGRLRTQVDTIVFTDDCSDDDTAEIAASYDAHVFKMNQPTFKVHEGALRQQSWINLESVLDGDDYFVLAIDCDEMLYETTVSLEDLAQQDRYPVISIEFYHMWNENQFRIDKAWKPHPSTRFFRYFPGGTFAQRQLACGSEPTYVPDLARRGQFMADSGLVMKHLSYIEDADKKDKYDRYMALDGGAFHANTHIQSIMDENPVLADWKWEGGGPE